METDLPTALIAAKSHEEITREAEDDGRQQISSLPDGAVAEGITIDNNALTLMGAAFLRLLSLDQEQIQEVFSTDSSAVANTSAQPRENTTREPPGARVSQRIEQIQEDFPTESSSVITTSAQLRDSAMGEPPEASMDQHIHQTSGDVSEEATRTESGLYQSQEAAYRLISKVTEEQWERFRATLCVDPSLYFPISLPASGLLRGYQTKGGPVTWFEDLIEDIESLAKFMKEGNQTEPVSNFSWIQTLKNVPGSTESVVWDLFNNILGFITTHEQPTSLKMYIQETYYNPVQSKPEKFSITLEDILDAGLEAEPTAFLDEHLKIVGNKVKILTAQWTCETLDGYPNNKFAVALGIQSLGPEIYTSLNVLYGLYGNNYQSNLLHKAQSLKLMPDAVDGVRMRVGLMRNQHAIPEVLSSRVLSLQALIAYRRSWWPSLKRDMERNRREQPYLFWGALLAILFGTSTVIQTVASVVSCYYAILAYRAMPQP